MKSDSAINRLGLLTVLAAMIVTMSFLIVEQSARLARAHGEAIVAEPRTKEESQRRSVEIRSKIEEKKSELRRMEQALPPADGYVWISRLLREANPRLPLTIDPPEMSQQEIVFAKEYCSGVFRVRGSGTVTDLLMLLRKIESDLPVASVQDLQFTFTDQKQALIDFNLSILAVMRLNEEPALMHASFNPAQP